MAQPTNTIEDMSDIISEVLDKYTFLDDYLAAPRVGTGKPIPVFIKFISTILYIRQRLGFLVEPDESFYDCINYNDYTQFKNIEATELYKILVAFVTFVCGYVNRTVTNVEERDKIMPNIRKYYYKNKDFIV
jgi:hypothetical protein